jgi:hypothetical protein
MSASRDEASYGFAIDAPFDVGTSFYALVGDNFYTYASSSSDIDGYYLITSIGTSYSIVSVDNSTVGNTYIGLYDLNGNFITGSVDSGAFSGITFTATSTKYFIGLSAQFPGIYGARVANNTITEANGIGESISFNRTYSGALDYVSDSDRFSFSVVAGKQYTLTYSTNVSDIYFKLTYLYNFSSTGYYPIEGVGSGNTYVYTAPASGVVELNLSSNTFVQTGSYNINVVEAAANAPPVFSVSSQSVSTNEDAAKAITVAATDANNDALTYSVSSAALHGTTSVSGGTITYTPAANYNGSDSFVVTASDGKGGTATQTVNMTVTPVNDPPTFATASQAVSATAGAAKTITLAAADVDGDALTYTVATPGKGTASIAGSTLTYAPASSASGSDSFVVTASDGRGGIATQTINMTVLAQGVTVAGTSGNDVLSGTQNRDVIQGLAGNDTIDGGSNVDTAIVSGLRAAYTTTQTSTGVWSVVGPDGTDTLRNIEYLKFDDQTMRLLPGTGTTVNFQTDSPATFMSGIRDFDGNDIGASSGWKRIGAVDVNGDGDVDQIFVNRTNGRLAEVGTAPDGKVYFNDYGWAGETRVVGIYIDPLVQSGQVTAGGPNDSQRRFQNDLNIDNIGRVLGAADYDRDGLQEVYFALTDGTAYLHTYMHADGNIQYANYQSKQEVVDYLAKNGWAAATTNGWFV